MPRPKPAADEPYILPGRPLEELRKEALIKASDADWVGDTATARKHDAEAAALQSRIDEGELYDVNF